ncbi:26S proteasome regulatory subunit, partial [Fasciolopsis buskii]
LHQYPRTGCKWLLVFISTTLSRLAFVFLRRTLPNSYLLFVTDWEAVVKLSDGFNGADLRNVCTEAGMFAIRAERDYTVEEDFMKAVRKINDAKKLETKLDYKPV